MRVDHGSHRLHRACPPEILATLRDLLGDGPPAAAAQRPDPARAAGGSRSRPSRSTRRATSRRGFVLRAARDAALAPFRRPRADTFAEVVRARLGPAMADDFYNPYVRKIWGVDPHAAVGRARPPPGQRRLGHGPRRSACADPTRTPARSSTPATGSARSSNGSPTPRSRPARELRLGARVTAFTEDGHRPHRRRAGARAPRLVDDPRVGARGPGRAGAAGRGDRRRALRSSTARSCSATSSWTATSTRRSTRTTSRRPDVTASRVSEPKNYRDGAGVDPTDRTVLCAELPCSPGRRDLGRGAGRRSRRGRWPSSRAPGSRPPCRCTPRSGGVRHAYPVYRAGYEHAFEQIDDVGHRAAAAPDVRPPGPVRARQHPPRARDGRSPPPTRCAPDGELDAARWAAARAEFRDHVVED